MVKLTRVSPFAGRRPCECRSMAATSHPLSLSPASEPVGEEETFLWQYFLCSISLDIKLKLGTGPPERSPCLSPCRAAASLPSSTGRGASRAPLPSRWSQRPPPAEGERRRPTDESKIRSSESDPPRAAGDRTPGLPAHPETRP